MSHWFTGCNVTLVHWLQLMSHWFTGCNVTLGNFCTFIVASAFPGPDDDVGLAKYRLLLMREGYIL